MVGTSMHVPTYKFDIFELDCSRFELRRDGRPLKVERIPLELLILLLEKNGQVVTRQEIIERLWGKDVFLDTEHGINTAIRKIRTALRDDVERPRFIQTVSGKGYRFVPDAVSKDANGIAGSEKILIAANPVSESPVPANELSRPARKEAGHTTGKGLAARRWAWTALA